jgi:hypothetical protein
VTATTDNTIRFWTAVDKSGGKHSDFAWEEWRMETEHGSSSIQVTVFWTIQVTVFWTKTIFFLYVAEFLLLFRGNIS